MSNETNYKLLKLLDHCAISFAVAKKFVMEDSVKMEVFSDAYIETKGKDSQGNPGNTPAQAIVHNAVEKAQARWDVISPAA